MLKQRHRRIVIVTLLIISSFYLIDDIINVRRPEDSNIDRTEISALKSERERPDFDEEMKNINSSIAQDDPRLIQAIQNDFLIKPSSKTYNLDSPYGGDRSERGQPKHILDLLGDMKNGFFVEAGAYDGEKASNTIYLERKFNWTGLLVEGGKKNVDKMIKKNRNSWISGTCLSLVPHPQMVDFMDNRLWGAVNGKSKKGEMHKVQCLPLFSLLLALNRTQIDFLSLDVESAELKVLKTIPWDRVQIKTIAIEFNLIPEGWNVLRAFMRSKGYILYANLQNWDYIYYHRKYLGRKVTSGPICKHQYGDCSGPSRNELT